MELQGICTKNDAKLGLHIEATPRRKREITEQ